MKRFLILLIVSFFSLQSYAGSCPDGSDPVKSISADGTYFVYNCGGSINNDTSSSTNSSSAASSVSNKNNTKGIDLYGDASPYKSIPLVLFLLDTDEAADEELVDEEVSLLMLPPQL